MKSEPLQGWTGDVARLGMGASGCCEDVVSKVGKPA
jgi:hypothetical protein